MIAVRSLVFVALFYLWSGSLAVIALPTLVGPRRWMMRVFTLWSVGIIALLDVCCAIRVEVRGRAFIPTGRALLAAKHQCMFDAFAPFAWLPDAFFVMRKEFLWIPVFGWHAVKTGMLIIDREGHSSALRQMMRDAKARLAEDRQLVIFPEGHRGEPGVAGDYKPGIAALYRELDMPVHPVATNSGVHWPAHGFLRRPGTIVFQYLPPIPPGLKRAEFMRTLEERIETASTALLGE